MLSEDDQLDEKQPDRRRRRVEQSGIRAQGSWGRPSGSSAARVDPSEMTAARGRDFPMRWGRASAIRMKLRMLKRVPAINPLPQAGSPPKIRAAPMRIAETIAREQYRFRASRWGAIRGRPPRFGRPYWARRFHESVDKRSPPPPITPSTVKMVTKIPRVPIHRSA